MAREVPGRPGFQFGLDDEPFSSGYAALAPATTDATGAAEIPLVLPETGPVSRPLTVTATLRVRDGSGRPVERSETRPLLPAAPLIGVRPLFSGAVDEGGTAGFEAIAVGTDLAPTDLAGVSWTLSRDRDRLPVVRGRRHLELRARHPPQPGRERHARPRGRHAPAARPAGRNGATTSSRSPPPTAATSRRASASTPAGAPPPPAPRRPTSSTSASTAPPTPPATPPAPASSSRTPASSSSPSWATG